MNILHVFFYILHMWIYPVFQGAKPHTVLYPFLFLLQHVYELFCLLLNIALKKHN